MKRHSPVFSTQTGGGRPSPALPRQVRALCAVAAAALLASGIAARAQTPCIGFLERPVDSGGLNGADSVFAVDLDGDGDPDVLASSHNDNRIVWYENDGASPPWTERTITADAESASAVFAADLDGDGDPDVLSASRNDGTVAWYENDGASPPVFRKRVITSLLLTPLAVSAADVDGDGDQDVLATSFADGRVLWFENLRDDAAGIGVLFAEHVVSTETEGAASVFAADLDGDGDTDVLSASRVDGKIAWHEQQPGVEIGENEEEIPVILFVEHVLTNAAEGANSVLAADLDGDQDLDVVAASTADNSIQWFENPRDGAVGIDDPFTVEVISDTAAGVRSVFAADLDGDGDVDIVSASANDDTIGWYENQGGTPRFSSRIVISSDTVSADAVYAADIDGRNGLDVLSISSATGTTFTSDKLAWYENDGAADPSLTERVIARTASGADSIATADLDGDGTPDLLAARSDNPLTWYQNDGAASPAFAGRAVGGTAINANSVLGLDLDGDTDVDMVAAYPLDGTILWYENDGQTTPGPAFAEHVVSSMADSVESIFAIDVDADGLVDVLSASSGDDKVAWYRNDGGSPPDFTEFVISLEADGAQGVSAADIDGDLDVDVLSASSEDGKIAWYENDGASPPGFTEHVITIEAPSARTVTAADLDDDGDTDVIISRGDGTITWYSNQNDGSGSELSFSQNLVATIAGVTEVIVFDVNLDQDLDIVTISSGSSRIIWLENSGSNPPVLTVHLVPGSAFGGRSVAVSDLDGDGDVDFAAGYEAEIVWYDQLDEICAGFDANGDGVIDGVELAWLSRAFGSVSDDPGSQWWAAIDLNRDGAVDGDDLSILASFGVWGRTTLTCSFSCQ